MTLAARKAAEPEVTMNDAWRQWIAENIMQGSSREAILATLRGSGFVAAIAESEVAAAEASPYVAAAARIARRCGKRDWLLANLARLEAMAGVDRAVPRRHALAPQAFFAEHYHLNRPVILTGMIDDWPALELWSLDHFEAAAGNPEIEVQVGRESDLQYELHAMSHKRRALWHDLLQTLRADPKTNDFYITANNGGLNRQALAPLWKEIGPLSGLLDPASGQDGFFWLGPRGTVTPWHHDLTNNLLVQIRGRKRITLAAPSQTPRMRNFNHCYSAFGTRAELGDVPPAERPRTATCELAPGEILFIPIGWWHHVEGLEMSVSLSFTNFVADNDFFSDYASGGDL